jgi:transcriptional regulator with XRE-family HTH domain
MYVKTLTPMKILRLERRLDRCVVATEIGVSDRTLARWEEGYSYPPLDAAAKLADRYQVSLDAIAGRTAPKALAAVS